MSAHRQLFTIPLKPAIGDRFQPTGFPNLGASVFDRPTADGGWQRCLLVESEQSMANRLEAVLWDAPQQTPIGLISDLPHIRIEDGDGNFLTSSRLEAHRIASVYVRTGKVGDQTGAEVISDRLGLDSDRQRPPHEIATALFGIDPLALVHGVFLSHGDFPGQPKVARAITAFIEAHDVREAYAGGVKKDSVHTGQDEGRGSTEGYGMVPFDRVEWTARDIVVNVDLDLAQITSYGLPETATDLLANIARLQLRYLLDGGLRLRTACDLVPVEQEFNDHAGQALPSVDALEAAVKQGIEDSRDLLEEPLTVVWNPS